MSEHQSISGTKEDKKTSSESVSNQKVASNEGASHESSSRVMAFKSLQAAGDNSPHSNSITQLQAIADDAANNDSNGILQLKAMADARMTTLTEPIQRQENNTGLPNNLKSGMENLSGLSMDDVKVHRNSDKPAQLQAHAYAQGTDIHLGPGQEKHLPHELGHVVQQKQGRVKPTKQMKGKVNLNDEPGLEKEADIMGKKSLSMADGSPHSEQTIQLQSNADNNQTEVVQRIGGLIANATKGFAKRAIPMAGRAVNTAGRSASKGEKAFKYGSKALAIGGGAAEISKLHQEGKFGMNRKSIIAGLGVHNPFGSYGTAVSLASTVYDVGQVIYKEAEKDGDKFTLNEANFKTFMLTAANLAGNALDLNGGKGIEVVSVFLSNAGSFDKILQDEGQLKETFIDIHQELSEIMEQNDGDMFRDDLYHEAGGYA